MFGVLAVLLTVFLLWTLFAPRGQWRALVGWSVGDIHRDEPSGVAYALRRLGAGIGLLGIATVTLFAAAPSFVSSEAQAPQPDIIKEMWGDVRPDVVNRIITPLGGAPGGLVEMPVLGYQSFSEETPSYVSRLDDFRLLGRITPPGYVGELPPIGNGALDFADIVVNVRGPLLCIPRQVVMFQSETSVQVAVYYGLPTGPDGAEGDSIAGCPADAAVTGSVLIPLQLAAPLDGRPVLTLTGEEIPEVPIVDPPD